MKDITWDEIRERVAEVAQVLQANKQRLIYGVPTGGSYVAGLLACGHGFAVTDDPSEADAIVDDIVDSGRTRERHTPHKKPFLALFVRGNGEPYYRFPWEGISSGGPEDAVVRLLQFVNEDPHREGLLDTPKRVLKSFKEMTTGYDVDPATLLATTFAGESYDGVVCCDGIEFTSLCEHHLLPFMGRAHIAYIPKDRVVGLSKLARLVDCYARRLQIQERMTQQIAFALEQHLRPNGVAVVVEARHECMACRGVRKPGAMMRTSSLSGAFRKEGPARSEFFSLVRQWGGHA